MIARCLLQGLSFHLAFFVLFAVAQAIEVYQIPFQRATYPQTLGLQSQGGNGFGEGQLGSGGDGYTRPGGGPYIGGPQGVGSPQQQAPPREFTQPPGQGSWYRTPPQGYGMQKEALPPQEHNRIQPPPDYSAQQPMPGVKQDPLSPLRSIGASTPKPGPSSPKTQRVKDSPPRQTPTSMEEAEELSHFERYVMEQIPSDPRRPIRQFGYEVFRRPDSYPFLAPSQQAMDPSYIIGPDDEILLRIWGKVTGDYVLKVDREGYIHIPGVGDIQVAGVRYGALQAHLAREIGKYFSGFELSTRVGRIRSIRVFVVGKARKPGTYELSSLSTIIHALGAAQGPSKTGSMRDVRLVRGGNTVAKLDLYDFLLRGDRTKDLVLQDGDVVLIPFVGPLVAVTGMVKEPAIYELGPERKLSEVIAMAGGVAATGYTPRVQVLRVKDNVYRVVMDLSLKEALETQDIKMQDGDIVQVFAVDERIANAIELQGNVYRPGLYEWKAGIRVSDIISKPEDLKPDTYMDVAMIMRYQPPDYHEELLSFNLLEAIKKNPIEDVALQPGDKIRIFTKEEFNIVPVVRITGAVWRPGEYKLREKMTLAELINLAGGLKYFASEWGELTRVRPTDKGPVTEIYTINLARALQRDPQHDIPLVQDDYLFVRTVPEWQLYRQVTVTGEVRFPGIYAVKKGERLSSVIERAGGFTEKAYLKGAIFTRKSVQEIQKRHYDEMIKRLEMEIATVNIEATQGPADDKEKAAMVSETIRQRKELLAKLKQVEPTGRVVVQLASLDKFKGTQFDLETEDGDSLHIPEVPNSVHVLGAVYNPTAFTYEEGRSVRFYLSRAGGPLPTADTSQIYVLKVNGMAVPPSDASHLVTWNPGTKRFEMDQFAGLQLDPGDTIIVPQDVERVPFLKGLKDVTTVLYQIAVSAGVLFTALF